jgi:hypothetical protein
MQPPPASLEAEEKVRFCVVHPLPKGHSLGSAGKAVNPICEAYFRQYQAEFGSNPGRNKMSDALVPQGISREQVRRDWRTLTGVTSATEGATERGEMQTVTPRADVAAQLEQMQAQLGALRTQLAKVDARGVSYERSMQAVEDGMRALAATLANHAAVVGFVEELLSLLRSNPDAQQTAQSMLSTSSVATAGVLHKHLAAKLGWATPRNYMDR